MTTDNDWLNSQDSSKVNAAVAQLRERDWTTGGRNWLDEAGGNAYYALWLSLCDRRMSRAIGLGIFDISDWTWADAYEWGASPGEACREALEADDTYAAMFGGE